MRDREKENGLFINTEQVIDGKNSLMGAMEAKNMLARTCANDALGDLEYHLNNIETGKIVESEISSSMLSIILPVINKEIIRAISKGEYYCDFVICWETYEQPSFIIRTTQNERLEIVLKKEYFGGNKWADVKDIYISFIDKLLDVLYSQGYQVEMFFGGTILESIKREQSRKDNNKFALSRKPNINHEKYLMDAKEFFDSPDKYERNFYNFVISWSTHEEIEQMKQFKYLSDAEALAAGVPAADILLGYE